VGALRRRAADARHRARNPRAPPADAARRALAGSLPAPGAGAVSPARRAEPRRPRAAAGRAEHAPGAAAQRARLRDGARCYRDARPATSAARRRAPGRCLPWRRNPMKRKLLLAALISFATPSMAQSELVLGYLTAETGPFVSLSRTNEVAARIAVDEINAAGGVNGKKLRYITF